MKTLRSGSARWIAVALLTVATARHGDARADRPPALVGAPGEAPSSTAHAAEPRQGPEVLTAAGARRGHLRIWDDLVIAAALGATWGVVGKECGSEGSTWSPIVGHMLLAGVGGLLGGNDEINPFIERHPADAASTLPELKRRLRGTPNSRPRVRVVTRDGAAIAGKLAKIEGDSIVIRAPGGLVAVQATSIQRIDSMGDPVWDQMLLGAIGGAGWAVIAANNCSDDPVTYVSRGRMAMIGAVIVGTTGLVLDLLHDGRFVLYRPSGAPGATTVRVTPMLRPNGVGVGIVLLF